MAATFLQNGFAMLVICVRIHTLMPAWQAEKPRETSWPVGPFMSFEAAQLSKTMRMFMP